MNDKSTWIKQVRRKGSDLENAPSHLRDDEDVVCGAVKKDYNSFQYASPLLQNDKKFFMEKLIPLSKYSPFALEYASYELKKDKEVVKKAVHYHYLSFQFANSELKDDRDFVKELVQLKIITDHHPAYALEYASIRVRNDKEVVLAAVKNTGRALEYASDELRNDKEVVREAVRDYGGSFKYASEELLNDREFCLECVKISENAFRYVSEELKRKYGKTKEEFVKRHRKKKREIPKEKLKSTEKSKNTDILRKKIEELEKELSERAANEDDLKVELEKQMIVVKESMEKNKCFQISLKKVNEENQSLIDQYKNPEIIIDELVQSKIVEKVEKGIKILSERIDLLKNKKKTAKLHMKRLSKIKMEETSGELLCGICFENKKNTVLIPCGHTLCNECVERIGRQDCPFCRKRYDRKQKIF